MMHGARGILFLITQVIRGVKNQFTFLDFRRRYKDAAEDMLMPRRLHFKPENIKPQQINQNEAVTDSKGRICYLYSDTLEILNFLKKKKYTLAVASRAKNICGSYQLLHLFGIANYFQHKEIYPGSKTQHFKALKEKSSIDFPNIVFFDNDARNTRDVEKLGVTCVTIREEITLRFILSVLNPKKTRK